MKLIFLTAIATFGAAFSLLLAIRCFTSAFENTDYLQLVFGVILTVCAVLFLEQLSKICSNSLPKDE